MQRPLKLASGSIGLLPSLIVRFRKILRSALSSALARGLTYSVLAVVGVSFARNT